MEEGGQGWPVGARGCGKRVQSRAEWHLLIDRVDGLVERRQDGALRQPLRVRAAGLEVGVDPRKQRIEAGALWQAQLVRQRHVLLLVVWLGAVAQAQQPRSERLQLRCVVPLLRRHLHAHVLSEAELLELRPQPRAREARVEDLRCRGARHNGQRLAKVAAEKHHLGQRAQAR